MPLSISTERMLMGILTLIFCAFVIVGFKCVAMAEGKEEDSGKECDVHKTSCTKIMTDCTVTLDIDPKPVKAMTDLTFTVILSGKKPSANPYIDLGMPGMKMGPNYVKLKEATGKNTYEGTGIIVRCPSGRRTWKAAVTVPDVGTAEFVFDVVY
jgi:hypothetical protein